MRTLCATTVPVIASAAPAAPSRGIPQRLSPSPSGAAAPLIARIARTRLLHFHNIRAEPRKRLRTRSPGFVLRHVQDPHPV